MDRVPDDVIELVDLHGEQGREDVHQELDRLRSEVRVLRRSEQLLTATLDATSDGILALDEGGKPLFFNTRFAEIWRLPQDKLGDLDAAALAAHKASQVTDPRAITELAQRRAVAPEVEDFDLVTMKDGRVVERRASPRRVQGGLVGSVVTFRDVTDRLEHERQRRRHDATLLSLLNSIADPIFYKDRDGRYLGCNDAYAEMHGLPAHRIRGRRAEDLFPPETARIMAKRDDAALSSQQKQSSEDRVTYPDGRCVVLETVVSPLWDEEGRAQGLVGTCRNVTLRKRAEEDSDRARRLAEEASHAKADFLANISHEIRTPLNGVIGLAELVLGTPLSADQRDWMDKLRSSGKHLLRLVDDVLDFSKIEAGKLELEEGAFTLDEALQAVSNIVGERCQARGLEFVIRVGGDVPQELWGDRHRLQQILLNYVGNAVKFTERGEIVLGVDVLPGCTPAADGTVGLKFSVRDTGIGMTQEQMARLFSSFSQAETSITRRFGGTGLGLAICKRLAALMGGDVGVQSTPGHGSTFWVTARFRAVEGTPAGSAAVDIRGLRALVVDDNEAARTVIGEMLRRFGVDVTEVAGGEAALREVAGTAGHGRAFDLVYLDWRMPGMDGIEAARRIRAAPNARGALVLMVTAYGRQEVIEQARACGIATVLAKPVSASVLLDATLEALGRRDRKDEATQPAATTGPLTGARILLVEDNEINQLVAQRLLQRLGAAVDVAVHGQEALEAVQDRRYDLVLMDLQMPVMDGLTATRELRKLPGCGWLPVIGLTANALAQHRSACIDAGMDDFLAKPIEPQRLLQTVQRWYAPASRPQATPGKSKPPGSPPAIRGLDARTGLELASGDMQLYAKLLALFVQTHADAMDHIRSALACGQRDEAARLAHRLVGSAGSIGAGDVCSAARALETGLVSGSDGTAIAMQCETLAACLQQLCEPLKEWLGAR